MAPFYWENVGVNMTILFLSNQPTDILNNLYLFVEDTKFLDNHFFFQLYLHLHVNFKFILLYRTTELF